MRLRADEKKAVLALLDEEYPDEDSATSAVWNGVIGLLAQRDSYGVRVRVGETLDLAYGPFWDQASAKRVVKELPGMAFTAPLTAPAGLTERLTGKGLKSQSCAVCKHPTFAHVGGLLGCVVGRTTNSRLEGYLELTPGCGCLGEER